MNVFGHFYFLCKYVKRVDFNLILRLKFFKKIKKIAKNYSDSHCHQT